MSAAPVTASASTRNPLTLDPSARRMAPMLNGGGTLATKAPKLAGSSVHSSDLIAVPAPFRNPQEARLRWRRRQREKTIVGRCLGLAQKRSAEFEELTVQRQSGQMRADDRERDPAMRGALRPTEARPAASRPLRPSARQSAPGSPPRLRRAGRRFRRARSGSRSTAGRRRAFRTASRKRRDRAG